MMEWHSCALFVHILLIINFAIQILSPAHRQLQTCLRMQRETRSDVVSLQFRISSFAFIITKIWMICYLVPGFLAFHFHLSSPPLSKHGWIHSWRKNEIISPSLRHINEMHQSESYSPTVFDLPGKDRWKIQFHPHTRFWLFWCDGFRYPFPTTTNIIPMALTHQWSASNNWHPQSRFAGESSFYCIPISMHVHCKPLCTAAQI